MVCAKCGKKISSFSDDCFCEVIDDKKVFLCKNCHDEYRQEREAEHKAAESEKKNSRFASISVKDMGIFKRGNSGTSAITFISDMIFFLFCFLGGVSGCFFLPEFVEYSYFVDDPGLYIFSVMLGVIVGSAVGSTISNFINMFSVLLNKGTKIKYV